MYESIMVCKYSFISCRIFKRKDELEEGGISSLEKEIKKNPEIELGVAFYYNKNISPFEYNKTKYYPIKIFGSKFLRIFYRAFGIIENINETRKFIKIINDFKT